MHATARIGVRLLTAGIQKSEKPTEKLNVHISNGAISRIRNKPKMDMATLMRIHGAVQYGRKVLSAKMSRYRVTRNGRRQINACMEHVMRSHDLSRRALAGTQMFDFDDSQSHARDTEMRQAIQSSMVNCDNEHLELLLPGLLWLPSIQSSWCMLCLRTS